jgi:DNA-binding transcriptional ArsR family regulator
MVNPTLQQEIMQLEANFCAALSDPSRLLILYALNDSPRNVTELANEIGLNQPTTSRHLKILRERGLVDTVRAGTTITYHLADRGSSRRLTSCGASCATDSHIKPT